jgi:hypothetical protein
VWLFDYFVITFGFGIFENVQNEVTCSVGILKKFKTKYLTIGFEFFEKLQRSGGSNIALGRTRNLWIIQGLSHNQRMCASSLWALYIGNFCLKTYYLRIHPSY